MPTPSESRVTVSGKPSKAVELLRKRLRLSLGAMMIIVLGIGGVLGWVAHRAHVQRDAVAAITTLRRNTRGSVYYDWQFVAGQGDKAPSREGRNGCAKPSASSTRTPSREGRNGCATPSAPMCSTRWSTSILKATTWTTNSWRMSGSSTASRRSRSQGHAAPDLTPAGMAQLRTLSRLKVLSVRGFTDSHGFVAGLTGKTGLRRLWLPQAAVTDDEMAIIGGFTDLEFLQLDGSNVTDRGFAHVANLKKLSLLDMPGVRITDLAPVADLVQLDLLVLAPDRATPARSVPGPGGPSSLGPLRRLTKVTQLILGATRIEDRDLAVVAGLPKLYNFMIGGEGDHGGRSGPARRIQEPDLPRAHRHVDRGLAASLPAPPCDLDPLDGEFPSHRRRDRAPVEGDSTHGLDHRGFEDDRRGT